MCIRDRPSAPAGAGVPMELRGPARPTGGDAMGEQPDGDGQNNLGRRKRRAPCRGARGGSPNARSGHNG
eukprot:8794355-Lingulodinium_polyedra.AAC.1